MEKEEMMTLVLKRYPGVYDNKLEQIASELDSMDPEFKLLFENFLTTGQVDNIEIQGYTVAKLKTEHGMNEVAAFLTLDWLKQEPEVASKSLERGHDFVGP